MIIFLTKKNNSIINQLKLVIKRHVKKETILKALGSVFLAGYSKWKISEYKIRKTNQNLNNTNNLITSYNKMWE